MLDLKRKNKLLFLKILLFFLKKENYMDNKLIAILNHKKAHYKLAMNVYGVMFILCMYFLVYNIFHNLNWISTILLFISAGFEFYFVLDTLKNTPKFNKNSAHFTFQMISALTIIFMISISHEMVCLIITMFINYILLDVFLYRYNKKNIFDLFSEKQIEEMEKEFKK